MSDFLNTLKERIVVFDGAMGTNLHAQDLTVDDFGGPQFEGCPEYLLVTKPSAVERVHAGFLEVGCDVIETDSFGGTPIVLAEYGIAEMAYELNLKAAQLARRVAADFSTKERPRWVAGSMGPGTKLPSLGQATFRQVKDAYGVQARGLLDGGADLLIVETCQDMLQVKAALMAIFGEFKASGRRVPVIAQVTIEQQGTMLMGTEIGAALTGLEPFPVDVVGMNCATGPKQMTENVRYLCQNSRFPVSVIPNAGIPDNVGGHAVFRETPESLAA
jgi:5-methyltetrahydrofolate--homocysteine methyltransferase